MAKKNHLLVTYWILKDGKPHRHFITKHDRTLYLKGHRIRLSPHGIYALKDVVKFTLAE